MNTSDAADAPDAANASDAVAPTIRREGPIPFSTYMEEALVGPEGFFTTGGGAGRAGADFVTSPEVGVLFGALVARALDGWWRELGSPDPFVVVEAGAGRGRLCADVLRAGPECAGALRYVLVEVSPKLRDAQRELVAIEPVTDVLGAVLRDPSWDDDPDEPLRPVPGSGPLVASVGELPRSAWPGVVLANELLDNLPVDIIERDGDSVHGWHEVRVGLGDGPGELVEVLVPAAPALVAAADRLIEADPSVDVPQGTRLPVPVGAVPWLDGAARSIPAGFIVAIDYMATLAELVERGSADDGRPGWLRTYRGHERGGSPLEEPGAHDITCDVALDALLHDAARVGLEPVTVTTQAAWLAGLGVDELVEEARATWSERAGVGDLEALAARSRVNEAAALTDPSGLGAHQVVVMRHP